MRDTRRQVKNLARLHYDVMSLGAALGTDPEAEPPPHHVRELLVLVCVGGNYAALIEQRRWSRGWRR